MPSINQSDQTNSSSSRYGTIAPSPTVCRLALALWLAILSTLRFWYASHHGLVNDEAYYWEWAKHLAPGYYDQGPGVALAIRLGLLFGSSTGAVRLAAPFDAAIVSIAGYCLASRIFRSEGAGLLAAVFLNVVPLMFIGGVLITHDSPQMATWALAIYALARACGIGDDPGIHSGGGRTEAGTGSRGGGDDPGMPSRGANGSSHRETRLIPRSAPAWWMAAGIFAGISMDCKYTAVLIVPCAAIFLAVSPTERRWIRTPWPYLALLCAVILFIPPVWWNATHHWASPRHILHIGGAQRKHLLDLSAAGDFLGAQVAVTMLFFFTMIWGVWMAWRTGRQREDSGLLLASCFSWPVFLLFFLLSFHGNVEANWPVPGYFSAIVAAPALAARGLRDVVGPRATALRIYHLVSIVLAVVGIAVLLFPEILLYLPVRQQTRDAVGRKDRTNEMYGWDQLASAVESAGWTPGGRLQVAGIRYQDPAQLSFWLPGRPDAFDLPVPRAHSQYDFWPSMPAGSDAIVVAPVSRPEDEADVVGKVSALFHRVTVIGIAPLWRKPLYSVPIARYLILRGEGYSAGPPDLSGGNW